jgi:hypothetical protein
MLKRRLAKSKSNFIAKRRKKLVTLYVILSLFFDFVGQVSIEVSVNPATEREFSIKGDMQVI